ncbi:hypothetical protein D3C81_1074490 [compost metagenome]
MAVDGQTGNARLEVRVAGHAITQHQAAFELLEGRVLAAGFAAQGFAVEGGDGLAQLLFKVGVDQDAVVDDKAGVAIEGVDQRLLTVAGGGQVAAQGQQALDRRGFGLALDEVLDRHPVDLGGEADLRHRRANIQGALAFEVAVIQAAAQGFQGDQAALALGFQVGVLDRQFLQGQQAERQVSLQIEAAQAIDRQQLVVAPGHLGRGVGQRRVAGAGQGALFLALDLGLARCSGTGRRFTLGRHIAVGVELVGLELDAQGLFGEVFDRQAATEGAVVEFYRQVFQGQAGGAALQAADQFELVQRAGVSCGWQRHADTVEEGAQVDLGDRQASRQLWGLVQVT